MGSVVKKHSVIHFVHSVWYVVGDEMWIGLYPNGFIFKSIHVREEFSHMIEYFSVKQV